MYFLFDINMFRWIKKWWKINFMSKQQNCQSVPFVKDLYIMIIGWPTVYFKWNVRTANHIGEPGLFRIKKRISLLNYYLQRTQQSQMNIFKNNSLYPIGKTWYIKNNKISNHKFIFFNKSLIHTWKYSSCKVMGNADQYGITSYHWWKIQGP